MNSHSQNQSNYWRNRKNRMNGCVVDPDAPPPTHDVIAWTYGGHPPTERMGSAAKLARLLEHTPYLTINAEMLWMLTGVRSNRHAKAMRDPRVAAVAERRGWRQLIENRPSGGKRSSLTREPIEDRKDSISAHENE
ncbi:hypothetical protein [Algisphaera agarilytica]|uniref:Uncharacterized protein n=1 Tax=Algisphaera agarilytica TaxID=1385975 RepID=A0A7X0LJ25_9BACT|nr:hypothetical protein [Algisphaera agarilytica]MBB6428850.1 hypothetical protein [Algisphaera agarilytica]